MRVFISGVMQGSRQDRDVQSQDYRQVIADAVLTRHPDVEVVDPWEMHPGAVEYTLQQAKDTLLKEIDLAGGCDVLIAYVPEASMGTSLEMWAAYQIGAPIFTISNMTRNWVLQSFSTQIHPTLEDFLAFVGAGGLEEVLDGRRRDG
jgi:hypothetical protein